MAAVANAAESITDAALFLRLWERQKLTPTLARHLLKMGWSASDETRMRQLAEANRESTLTPAEAQELETYLRVGMTLSILQSRARKLLNKSGR